MKAIVQRVSSASVSVQNAEISRIDQGLLVLVGVALDDEERDLFWMADKVTVMRIFADDEGKMNRSIVDVHGAIMLVSQFTLLADISKGRRPSFVAAAEPEKAKAYYEKLVVLLRERGIRVAQGEFGADMRVTLVNDGPVTITLDSPRTTFPSVS